MAMATCSLRHGELEGAADHGARWRWLAGRGDALAPPMLVEHALREAASLTLKLVHRLLQPRKAPIRALLHVCQVVLRVQRQAKFPSDANVDSREEELVLSNGLHASLKETAVGLLLTLTGPTPLVSKGRQLFACRPWPKSRRKPCSRRKVGEVV